MTNIWKSPVGYLDVVKSYTRVDIMLESGLKPRLYSLVTDHACQTYIPPSCEMGSNKKYFTVTVYSYKEHLHVWDNKMTLLKSTLAQYNVSLLCLWLFCRIVNLNVAFKKDMYYGVSRNIYIFIIAWKPVTWADERRTEIDRPLMTPRKPVQTDGQSSSSYLFLFGWNSKDMASISNVI